MLVLPNCRFVCCPKTGSLFCSTVIKQACPQVADCGQIGYHIGIDKAPGQGLPMFGFVRHPVTWYQSYWRHRMAKGWANFEPDLSCRSNHFPEFVERVIARHKGWQSRYFELWLGKDYASAAFVGRYENLVDDLCLALGMFREDFDASPIVNAPKKNVGDTARFPTEELSPDLTRRLLASESQLVRRFYTSDFVKNEQHNGEQSDSKKVSPRVSDVNEFCQKSMPSKRRAFVRVLWGDAKVADSRVHKVREDIKRAAAKPHQIPAMTYVYGRDNYEFVVAHGFEARLVSSDCSPWGTGSPSQKGWRTKVESIRVALREFDEVVFLDWDIWANRQIDQPAIFNRLATKASFQANLFQYRRRQVKWRRRIDGVEPSPRKVPSAAFVYCREPFIIQRICEIMDERKEFTEEQAMAFFIDDLYGGWKGVENYLIHHEPFCCHVKNSAISPEFSKYIEEKEYWFSY